MCNLKKGVGIKEIILKLKMKKGHKIKKSDLLKKRPALGIRSRDIKKAIGRRLKQNVNINSPMSFIHFNKN